jgi:esterase/lipase superfamily enzyme
VRRDEVGLWAPELGWTPRVIAHGSYGRPLLVFPSSEGRAEDAETFGLVDAVRPLLDAGRVKLYCVDSWDGGSWYRRDLPLEERARLHEAYERWVVEGVVPFVDADCGGRQDMAVAGCSLGGYHAANLALRRADLFPLALCFSGVYDLSALGWGERGTSFHLNTPLWSLAAADGAHLEWLRARLSLLLVCGQGMWEDTTGALDSTRAFGALCAEKGLRVETDLWGHDVPHDWPSWRAQLAHHLPRFV